MRILSSLEEIAAVGLKNSAVTIGVFDGVHLGHESIIDKLIKTRNNEHADNAILITFSPHPLAVTHSRIEPPLLSTIDERIELLGKYPLDGIFVIDFNKEVADLSYKQFIDKFLLHAMNMKHLVIGYDFHLGRNREGDPDKLKGHARRHGYKLKVVDPVDVKGVKISSTQIRNLLVEGDFQSALHLLGHPYVMKGGVVTGHGRGRSLGFPTANLAFGSPRKLWPSGGVYAVKASIGDLTLNGMMNIGSSPTMKKLPAGTREIEIHLFDFNDDIYGKELTVYCFEYIRPEKKFPNPETLKRQLEMDRITVGRYFSAGGREPNKCA